MRKPSERIGGLSIDMAKEIDSINDRLATLEKRTEYADRANGVYIVPKNPCDHEPERYLVTNEILDLSNNTRFCIKCRSYYEAKPEPKGDNCQFIQKKKYDKNWDRVFKGKKK